VALWGEKFSVGPFAGNMLMEAIAQSRSLDQFAFLAGLRRGIHRDEDAGQSVLAGENETGPRDGGNAPREALLRANE